MAWRNIKLKISFPDTTQCMVTDFSLLNMASWPQDLSPYITAPTAKAADFNVDSTFTTIMGESPNYVDANKVKTSNNSSTVRVYMEGLNNPIGYGNEFLTSDYTWGYIAAVDDENQVGLFAMVHKYRNNINFGWWAGAVPCLPDSAGGTPRKKTRERFYILLTGNEFPLTLRVTYSIPQDTYTYCKLTYKKDERPNDVNDGTSIDISPNSKTVNVEGLDENQLYYFTIFTDKNESESFPFTVA